MFPNILSTRVAVGTQSVYMLAGLAKKRPPAAGDVATITTTSESNSSTPSGGVVTQPALKQAQGALSTQATPTTTTGVTGLSSVRPDYSTQSPLAISNKAASDGEATGGGVAMNGGEGVELEGVSKAKRIRLSPEEEVRQGMRQEVNCMASDITANGNGKINAKLENLLNKNHQLLHRHSRSPSPSLSLQTTNPHPPSPAPSLDSTPLQSSPASSRTISPLPPDTPPCLGPSPSPGPGPGNNTHPRSSSAADSLSVPSALPTTASDGITPLSLSTPRHTTPLRDGKTCNWVDCNR